MQKTDAMMLLMEFSTCTCQLSRINKRVTFDSSFYSSLTLVVNASFMLIAKQLRKLLAASDKYLANNFVLFHSKL